MLADSSSVGVFVGGVCLSSCSKDVIADDVLALIFSVISLWNSQGLTNRSKVFLFKFFNNILGINTRLSHFVPNHSRGCTFCSLNGILPVPDETFMHIFF